jgi:transposase-like protein
MKTKESKKAISQRKPYSRLSEEEKRKIVQEINSGLIGLRAAGRKYGISRNNVSNWIVKYSLLNLKPLEIANNATENMDEKTKIRELSRQIRYLTEELENSKLKVKGLETLIAVSEEQLKIKITKKSGAKRSKD